MNNTQATGQIKNSKSKRSLKSKRSIRTASCVAIAVGAFAMAGSGPAMATNVELNPTGAGLTGGTSITSFYTDTQNGQSDATALIQSTGTFTETGIIEYQGFSEFGTPLSNKTTGTGLTNAYNLFLTYTLSGLLDPWNPLNPSTAGGTISSISYNLIGDVGANAVLTQGSISPTGTPSKTPTANAPSINYNGDSMVTLATGGAVNLGIVNIAAGVPTASVILDLTQIGNEFFEAPPGVDIFAASFTNSPLDANTETTALNSSSSVALLIDGSFTSSFGVAPVPEPASLAVLGTGLLGLAGIIKRRRKV